VLHNIRLSIEITRKVGGGGGGEASSGKTEANIGNRGSSSSRRSANRSPCVRMLSEPLNPPPGMRYWGEDISGRPSSSIAPTTQTAGAGGGGGGGLQHHHKHTAQVSFEHELRGSLIPLQVRVAVCFDFRRNDDGSSYCSGEGEACEGEERNDNDSSAELCEIELGSFDIDIFDMLVVTPPQKLAVPPPHAPHHAHLHARRGYYYHHHRQQHWPKNQGHRQQHRAAAPSYFSDIFPARDSLQDRASEMLPMGASCDRKANQESLRAERKVGGRSGEGFTIPFYMPLLCPRHKMYTMTTGAALAATSAGRNGTASLREHICVKVLEMLLTGVGDGDGSGEKRTTRTTSSGGAYDDAIPTPEDASIVQQQPRRRSRCRVSVSADGHLEASCHLCIPPPLPRYLTATPSVRIPRPMLSLSVTHVPEQPKVDISLKLLSPAGSPSLLAGLYSALLKRLRKHLQSRRNCPDDYIWGNDRRQKGEDNEECRRETGWASAWYNTVIRKHLKSAPQVLADQLAEARDLLRKLNRIQSELFDDDREADKFKAHKKLEELHLAAFDAFMPNADRTNQALPI